MRYRKKPVEIEAVQWTGDNITEIIDLSQSNEIEHIQFAGVLKIPTLEGEMTASKGDWIIRGVQGELYPCKPDIFEQTYDKAE